MKYLESGYVFDASAKTIQFTAYPSGTLNKSYLILITNVEDNIIIYNFADSSKGGSIAANGGGDILTLDYDTTSMADTDELQIYLDDYSYPAGDSRLLDVRNAVNAVRDRLPSVIGQNGVADSVSVALANDYGDVAVTVSGAVPVTDNGGSLTVDNTVLSVVGGGTEATAQRVTIASDSTGVLSVDDNGSTLSIDDGGGNISIDDGGNSITVDNAGTFATQIDGAALTALQLIDDTVVSPSTSSAGVKVSQVGGTVGTSAPSYGNGAIQPISLTTGGSVRVEETNSTLINATTGISSATRVDDAAFTPGTDRVMMVGAQLDNTSPDSVDEGDAGALRMSANRNLFVNIRDAAGNERGLSIDANGEPGISAIRSALPAGTNAIGKLAANDGVDIGDVTLNNTSIAVTQSGTWDEVGINDSGNSITVDAPIGTPVNVQIGNGTLAAGVIDETGAAAVDALAIGGGTAHDAVDSGNPIKIGGKVSTAIPTAVANADRVNGWFDEYGRQVVSDMDTELGLTTGLTALRDRIVAQRYTVIADSLADGINAFWTQTAANGGTVTSTVGEGQLKTSTATNGSIQIVSPTVPYYPGQVAWMNSAVRFNDTGTAGDIRRVGMFTLSAGAPQEGFYFELSGTTLNAVYVKAGSATAVASASWSRATQAPFTLDTNYHSFEIRYTANSVWFYIDNVLRHAVSGTTTPLTTTLTLPIAAQNIKTSGASDITFAIRNIGNGRFGQPGGVLTETGLSALDAFAVGGATPHDSVDSGNPVKVGAKAASALPTAVATGDRTNNISDVFGRQLFSHIDASMQVAITKTAYNTTSTQTGAAMWTPAAGKKIALTHLVIGTYGTTAARVIIWFGGSGDTTYTAGTDQAVVIASFAPSATVKPGLVLTPAVPIFCNTADNIMRITTDAAISIDVTWSGYEF